MRSRRAHIAAILGAAAVAAPSTASADHLGVQGTIDIYRGTNQIATSTATAACPGTLCSVDVALPSREYNRFLRWCDTDTIGVGILAGQFSGVTQCPGGGQWRAFLAASLYTTTHASLVGVQIRAIPQ